MDLRPLARRWGDPAIGLLLATAYPLEVAHYPRAVLPGAAVVAALAGACLALRRRAPLVVLVAVLAGTQVVVALAPGFQSHSVFLSVAFLLALYSAGRHTRGVEMWLGVGCLLIAVVLLEFDSTDTSPSGIVFYLFFTGLPWGAGVAIRLRIERVGELRARNAALQEEARRAVADERARIARELHDVVSHAIAVTVLQARGSRRLVGRDDAAVTRALEAIESTNTSALTDMRRLLSLLRGVDGEVLPLEPQPTLQGLEELIEQVRTAGVDVTLVVDGERLPVTPGVDLSAYRIVQEALTNVLKHGGAGARATVRIEYGPSDLCVEVDSTTTSAAPGLRGTGGHGLVGIRERVAVTGGTIEVGPAGFGWRVRATMPYLAAS